MGLSGPWHVTEPILFGEPVARYRLTMDVPTAEDVVEVLKLLDQRGFTGDLTVNLTPEKPEAPRTIQQTSKERLWGTFIGERALRELYVLRAIQEHPEGVRPSQISGVAGRSGPWAMNVLNNLAQNLGFYGLTREELFHWDYRKGYTIVTPGPWLRAHPLPQVELPVRKLKITPKLNHDPLQHLPGHPDP